MNKKILSIIAIAILILICIIAPNVKATTENQNDKNPQAIFSHITENGKNYDIMAVLLQPQDVSKIIKSVNRRNTPDNEFNNLTKSDVVDMCETKYKIGTISNIYKVNEENQAIGIVESDTDKVGTGYVIELTNGKKLTVVLYGDVNGDGIIGTADSISLSKHNTSKEKITNPFKLKAAKLTSGSKNNQLSTRDTLRLTLYNIGLIGPDSERGHKLIDDELLPENDIRTVDFDSIIEDEVNKLSEDANFKLEYTKQSEQINIQVKNRAQKTAEIENTNISYLLENILKTGQVKTLTIKSEKSQALKLNENESLENIKSGIKKWLADNTQTIFERNDFNNLINGDFAGKTLTVTVELADGLNYNDGLTSRDYKIKFTANPITVKLECDKKQFNSITLENAGLIPENQIPKDEVIIAEDGISYKILGWTLQGDSTSKYFDFKTNRVDYDITLKADIRKIVDIDKDINNLVEAFNQTETGKNIFNLSTEESNKTIKVNFVTTKDKLLNEIDIEGLIQSIKEEINKEEVSEIAISNYVLNKETAQEDIKAKLLETLVSASVTTSDEIKLSDLVGKTLNVTIKLNQDKAIFDDNTNERNYNIKFDDNWAPEIELETVDFDSVIEGEVNKLSEDTNFKIQYVNPEKEINIQIKNRVQKTAEVESSNISQILENILKSDKIKTLTIKYENEELLTLDANESLDSIREKIKKSLTDNLQTISGRDDYNNLINGDFVGKQFAIVVELKNNMQFDNGLISREYKVVFKADSIIVTLECDKKQFDNITLENAGLIPEDKIPKDEVITAEDGTRYKILGWTLKGQSTPTHFDFKTNRVDGDITLKADLREIVDLDKEINKAVNVLNTTETVKDIFNLSMQENSRTINADIIAKKDQNIEEIISENILQGFLLELKKAEISEIKIADYILTKETVSKEKFKTELLQNIAKALEINSDQIKLSDLVGKTLNITVNLKKDIAIFDDSTYERNYNIKFDEDWEPEIERVTVDIDQEIENAVNTASEDANFKITKEGEQIKIHVQNRAEKTSKIEDSNISNALESILKSDKIKTIEIKYGNVQELNLNANASSDTIKLEIAQWLTKNVQNIFGRTNFNNLINGDFAGKTFTLTVKLADGMQLADKSISKTYSIAFEADPITVTLECDKKQFNSITLDNAGLIPENQRPSNETIHTNDGDYKILGWTLQDESTSTYFNFNNDRVDYNITLKADIRKIVDSSSNAIKQIIAVFNQTETGKNILNFSMDESSKTINVNVITENDKKINEIDIQSLAQALIEDAKKEEISEIVISDYAINNQTTKENIISNLIDVLAKCTQKSTNQVMLSDLKGKTLNVKIKLNQNIAIYNNNNYEENYIIKFNIKTDNSDDENTFMSSIVNDDLSTISAYKFAYLGNNNLQATVKHSSHELKSESGLVNTLNKLSQNKKIEEIYLIYGQNSRASITNLINTNKLNEFFSSNWNTICSCGDKHTWSSATNECLINSKTKLKIEIKLKNLYEFKNGKNSATYTISFVRDTVNVKLHLRNENTKTITASEGLPLNKESINQQLLAYGGYEFKAWYSDSSKQHKYTFTEKVTSDIDLYGAWYTILNIDNDIAYTIHYTAQANNDNDGVLDETIKDTVRETVSNQNILTKIFDVTKDKSTLLNTALAKTLKSELGKEGVISIKVSVTGGATYTFYNSVISAGEATKQKLLSELCNNTSKLENVIGKNLKIEITVDNSIVKVNGKQGAGKNTTLTYKVEFKRLITKKQVTEFGKSLFSLVNNNSKVKLTSVSGEDLQVTVARQYRNSLATDVADGCGGKTALQDFFNKSGYFKSLEFWADSYSNRATLNFDALGFWEIIEALYDIPTMLGGSDESIISAFDGKYLTCKEILKDDCIYENGRSLIFKIYFNVEK